MKIPRFKSLVQTVHYTKKSHLAVARLCSDPYVVKESDKILEVSEELNTRPETNAIGVINEAGILTGIVVKRDLFGFLARPYAREVMKNRIIKELMEPCRIFMAEMNIFSVADEIQEDLRDQGQKFYGLTDESSQFCGIFSSKDMLVYLSDITQNDIAMARRIQRKLVKESDLFNGRDYEFASASLSARGVAGDFCITKKIANNRRVIGIGDVSGKGVAASIINSVLWGMFQIHEFRDGLGSFLSKLNQYLFDTFEAEKYITAVFLLIDEEKKSVSVCDLGHSHLIIFRDGKPVKSSKKTKSIPIGVMPDMKPDGFQFHYNKEDMIFIYTDGLVEQKNSNGQLLPLKDILRQIQDKQSPVEKIRDNVYREFMKFKADSFVNDDVTFGILRFFAQELTW